MKRIAGVCQSVDLLPTEGIGRAIAIRLTNEGDEPVPISGVMLARKGLNVLPEFAQGFDFDLSNMIVGLEPDRYQVRVDMLASHQGKLLYGDGKSQFFCHQRNLFASSFRFLFRVCSSL